jgi:hypothetical protein
MIPQINVKGRDEGRYTFCIKKDACLRTIEKNCSIEWDVFRRTKLPHWQKKEEEVEREREREIRMRRTCLNCSLWKRHFLSFSISSSLYYRWSDFSSSSPLIMTASEKSVLSWNSDLSPSMCETEEAFVRVLPTNSCTNCIDNCCDDNNPQMDVLVSNLVYDSTIRSWVASQRLKGLVSYAWR